MKEIWKEVKNYPRYLISNTGKVWGQYRGKCLKLHDNVCGYPVVILISSDKKTRKTARVHRLVAEAFTPNPNRLPVVNHIDGNRKNNLVTNLEWCTIAQNCQCSKVSSRSKTGIRGVSFNKKTGKWRVQVGNNNKSHFSKEFNSIEEAKSAYNQEAIKRYGRFAYLNK